MGALSSRLQKMATGNVAPRPGASRLARRGRLRKPAMTMAFSNAKKNALIRRKIRNIMTIRSTKPARGTTGASICRGSGMERHPGWQNLGEFKTDIYENAPTGINYGPKSYRVEIQYKEYPKKTRTCILIKTKTRKASQTLANGQKDFL